MDVDYPTLEVPTITKAEIQKDLERKWSSFKDDLKGNLNGNMQETHVNDDAKTRPMIKGGEFLVRD
jgi:hypothetical protein